MCGLHGRKYTEFGKAWNIIERYDLGMFHPETVIGFGIFLKRLFVCIERKVISFIADSMGAYLITGFKRVF